LKIYSFIELIIDWDFVSSQPIKTREQRLKIPERIMRIRGKGEIVQCFRDASGYLVVAHRKKRLPDYC